MGGLLCELVAVGRSLWVGRYGLVAVAWSLCRSVALSVALWARRSWFLGVGRCGWVAVLVGRFVRQSLCVRSIPKWCDCAWI